MTSTYRLEEFGSAYQAPARDLAHLHARLLPQSPLSMLGLRFLEKFYYTLLPRDGFIFGAVAYVDDKPAGFVCATADSNGIMKAAILKRLLRWVWAFASALLTSPRALLGLWEIVQIMRTRDLVPCEGEILSLGVLPEYRGHQFVRETGMHLARDLVNQMTEQFRERGVPMVRVIADDDNIVARKFYSSNGWKLESEHVPGWRVPSVEYILRPLGV